MTKDVIDSRSFSTGAYARLIEALRGKGYVFCGFNEVEAESRNVILRHDVDFSLEAAAEMAALEKNLEVRSTYFVLLRTEFYNIHSATALALVRQVVEAGHSVGLHFDASLYSDDAAELEAQIGEECTLLQSILGQPVTAFSYHRPAPEHLATRNEIAGRICAYGKRFMSEIGYCSDSRGGWHHGHPLDHEAIGEGRALQLLTHPIWWRDNGLPPSERLEGFLRERSAILGRELGSQSSVVRPYNDPQDKPGSN